MNPGEHLFTRLRDKGLIEGSWDGLPPERKKAYAEEEAEASGYTHLNSAEAMEAQSR